MTSKIDLFTFHGKLRQQNSSEHACLAGCWPGKMSCICCTQLSLAELVFQTSALSSSSTFTFTATRCCQVWWHGGLLR